MARKLMRRRGKDRKVFKRTAIATASANVPGNVARGGTRL